MNRIQLHSKNKKNIGRGFKIANIYQVNCIHASGLKGIWIRVHFIVLLRCITLGQTPVEFL